MARRESMVWRVGLRGVAVAVMSGLVACSSDSGRTIALVPESAAVSAPASQPTTSRAHAEPPLVLGRDTVVTADVQYAKSSEAEAPFQRLNIYAPKGGKNLPVVIFVHGGGWTRGDRAVVGSQPRLFNDAGIVLVSIDYRLSPAVQHPAHVEDVARAVAWVHANIGKHGGDPERIFVMGHSAGSHLAALVATDSRPLAKVGLKISDLRGAIMLDGSAFDIPDRIVKGGDKLAENCRRAFGVDPRVQADASPVNHIQAGKAIPPFLLIYVKEGSLNHAQSKTVADRLNETGGVAKLTYVDGKTHASLVEDLGTDNNDNAGPAIVEFVQRLSGR